MSTTAARLTQVNLIVKDMDAAVAFYRRLGMTVRFDGGEWPAGSGARHVALENGDGAIFELDNHQMAAIYHAAWRSGDASGPTVVCNFTLESRNAVDECYQALVADGYAGRQEPYDAFFGARYAVVGDPEGNDVGLMSPIYQHRRFTPSSQAGP